MTGMRNVRELIRYALGGIEPVFWVLAGVPLLVVVVLTAIDAGVAVLYGGLLVSGAILMAGLIRREERDIRHHRH